MHICRACVSLIHIDRSTFRHMYDELPASQEELH